MDIDWSSFTPGRALFGGALVGLAAVWLALANGRIAGISGIAGGLFHPGGGSMAWRASFIAGLVAAPTVYALVAGGMPVAHIDAGPGLLVAAGLLVGFGARYGSGCTSGHGVCGLSRRSPRSLAATAIFTAAGFATVYVMRHVLPA